MKKESVATPKKQFRPLLDPELEAPIRRYAGNHNLRSIPEAIAAIVRKELKAEGIISK